MHHLKFPYLQLLALFLVLSACHGKSANSNDSNNSNTETSELQTSQQQEKASPEVRISPGHIVMMVTDLDRTVQFYEEHVGFHKTEEVVYEGLRRIFMSASDKHHELVLLESRVPKFPPVDHRQLQQVAFEVPTHDVLVNFYNNIKQTDIPYVIMDNQVSLSLYFSDPDGVTVEIYWDITDQPFGEKMWRGNQVEISEEKFLNPFEQMEQ